MVCRGSYIILACSSSLRWSALRRPVVGLLSDFGLNDPYVAEMKAVILSICEDAQIVDISHGIEKFDVRMGAFMLASAVPYFPEGTVYVAVVDPSWGPSGVQLLLKLNTAYSLDLIMTC